MIKKILFGAFLGLSSLINAQSLQLLDVSNNPIGANFTFWDSGANLAETKFHVKNNSSNTVTFYCKVYEISNPNNTDLQVCFGTQCFVANAGTSAGQVFMQASASANGGIYPDLKVAPFSFGWANGDSAVWKVTVYDANNPNDSVSTISTWKTTPASIDEIKGKISFELYPNPAQNVINITYNTAVTQSVKVEFFDMLGKLIMSKNINKSITSMDVSGLKSGVYFYTIKVGNETIETKKLIIK